MKIGERVKRARSFLKMNQEEFGKVAGVSKAAVSQWENGVTTPQRDALLNLYRKRHISPDWIASGRGEMIEPDRSDVAPNMGVTVDQAKLLALWAQLLPGEKAELLDKIESKAEHNRQVREQPIETITVSMSERRRVTHATPFPNRRKDHG